MRAVQPTVGVNAVPEFLIHLDQPDSARHWTRIGTASLVVHIALLVGAVLLGKLPGPDARLFEANVAEKPRQVTKLVAPVIGSLTQRSPNRKELSKEFNIASLPPRPERNSINSPGAPAPPKPAQKFKAPVARPGAAAPSAPLPEAPATDVAQLKPQGPLPSIGVPGSIAPPPQIAAAEKPKLAFERPGAPSGIQQGIGRVPVPKPSIEDAMRQAARSAGSRGLSVGDEEEGGAPMMPGIRPGAAPGKIGSSVELLSDPQGADFVPYLRAVLAAVRRNWYAIIPESARMGRTGRVQVQFSIEKSGGLAKIVIASPSGARELDLAAVAGVTASNPFPPLPTDFRGNQVRLQFSFRYNGTATIR